MPATPKVALPYPAPTDPVAQGADAIRKLAQSVENMVQYGTVSIDLATDANNSATVTFPTAFAGNPQVVATPGSAPGTAAGSYVIAWATGISPTGVTIGAKRTAALAGATFRWMAVGPVATVT